MLAPELTPHVLIARLASCGYSGTMASVGRDGQGFSGAAAVFRETQDGAGEEMIEAAISYSGLAAQIEHPEWDEHVDLGEMLQYVDEPAVGGIWHWSRFEAYGDIYYVILAAGSQAVKEMNSFQKALAGIDSDDDDGRIEDEDGGFPLA